MSDEEVDELLKIADTSSGEVNYTGMRSLKTSIKREDEDADLWSRTRPHNTRELDAWLRFLMMRGIQLASRQ